MAPQPLKKKSLVYILAKKILLALKLIYLAPLSQQIYKLTHETKNEKNYQIILIGQECIDPFGKLIN